MPFKLREATPRDAAILAALHVETFRETHGGGPPVSVREAQWERILGANDALDFTFVVAEHSNQLVGFARGTRHADGIERAVSPQAPGVVAITKWVGTHVLATEARKDGRAVGKATYAVSDDGKSLTTTVAGIDAAGKVFDHVIVFDRPA